MELELPLRATTASRAVHECAAAAISCEHRPFHLRRYRPGLPCPCLSTLARLLGKTCLLSHRLAQRHLECPLDNERGITTRDLVTEKILKLLQVVPGLLTDSDVKSISSRRERYSQTSQVGPGQRSAHFARDYRADGTAAPSPVSRLIRACARRAIVRRPSSLFDVARRPRHGAQEGAPVRPGGDLGD